MKKAILFAAAAFLLVFLGGCAQLFEFNLFSALDGVRLPDKASLEAMPTGEALDYLEEQLSSPKFTDALVNDPDALGDVTAYLDEARGNADTPEEQRATVLYADLKLKTTGGEEVVNNVTSLLTGDIGNLNFSDQTSVEDFLSSIMGTIIPPDLLDSRAAFDELLTGFQDAWGAYDQLGANLPANPPPDSINMGDVAQKALFSFLVAEALTDNGLYATEADARDALWDMANGVTPTAPAGAGTFSDPFAAGSSMNNILDTAGVSFTS